MPTCKIKEFKIKLNSLVLEDMTDRFTSDCKEIISIYLYILITLTIYNFNKIYVLGNFS